MMQPLRSLATAEVMQCNFSASTLRCRGCNLSRSTLHCAGGHQSCRHTAVDRQRHGSYSPIHSEPAEHRANPEVCLISPIIHRLQPESGRPAAVPWWATWRGRCWSSPAPAPAKPAAVVWRAVNLLLQGAVNPAELALCTFSKKAAGELRQRFDAAARAAGCADDLSAVRIGTVHSLCRRIVSQHGQGRRPQNPISTLLDEFAQLDLMNAHFHRIFGPDRDELRRRGWRTREFTLRQGRRYFERIAEEAIDPEDAGRRRRPLPRRRWAAAACATRRATRTRRP